MFITVSYINLFMLLAVSICHTVLAIVYRGQCPAAPSLTIILLFTGIIGVVLSIIALVVNHFDAYDGSNRWNLLLTFILFIYLVGSRVGTTLMTFRLASRSNNDNHCAPVLNWISALLTVVSYSIIIITFCLFVNLIVLQRRYNKLHQSASPRISMSLL